MRSYIEIDKGQIGFGETKELALRDLTINKCRQDINNDITGEFLKRREELYPWQPRENMLHLNKLGCLVYENNMITNTKTGKKIVVGNTGNAIFYYIATLFGTNLSYTDITVAIRPELDNFFKSISDEFVLIKEMPQIKLLNKINGFMPYVIYYLEQGILVAMSDSGIGMKLIGDEYYYVVDIQSTAMSVPLLSYIGYRIGIIFSEEGIEAYGEED